MYSLYHKKEESIIRVHKTRAALKDKEHKEEVTRYNDCYYLCLKRKPLIEFARQMRDDLEALEIIKNRVPKRLILEFVSLEEEDVVAKALEVKDE